jgi:hypothetical protein
MEGGIQGHIRCGVGAVVGFTGIRDQGSGIRDQGSGLFVSTVLFIEFVIA